MTRILVIAMAAVSLLVPGIARVHAQAQPTAAPATFEAASVKRNTSGDSRMALGGSRGSFTATNAPLRLIIAAAYQLEDLRIVGGPSWIASDRFDIVAKAPENQPASDRQSMLQALLADRFKLTVKRETRDMPAYALVVSGANRNVGVGLRPTAVDCAPIAGRRSACGITIGNGSFLARGTTMAQLVANLSPFVGRTIVDRTGLEGLYDFDLRFAPDGGNTATAGDSPSIFTALQEQLGLKLEARRAPVEVLVIGSVQRPTDD